MMAFSSGFGVFTMSGKDNKVYGFLFWFVFFEAQESNSGLFS